MKYLFVSVLFAFLILGQNDSLFAQLKCDSSFEVKTVSKSDNLGEIKVDISTNGDFECKLFTVSGKGFELINSKRGSGNESISFDNVSSLQLYRVEIEFKSESNSLCRRLQKNNLIFEQ